MDGKIIAAAIDRVVNSYTMMGMRGNDLDRLVVGALKHLVSLEERGLRHRA